MGRLRSELTEKHWRALKLLEEGLARKDVAAKMGWGIDYFNDLCNGNIEKAGYTADLFKKEIKKFEQKQAETTKTLITENTATAQALIKRTLAELKSKTQMTLEEKKLLGTLTNCLAKFAPSVAIDSLSYSYTKGMTPEELLHEFTRLKAIAENSFNRSA